MPPLLTAFFKRPIAALTSILAQYATSLRRHWQHIAMPFVKNFMGPGHPRWVRILALITLGKIYRLKGRPFYNPRCHNPIPDGCTWVPNFNFRDVCDQHDLDYAAGGTAKDRHRADQALKQGIAQRGHPILAMLYYSGVRLIGAGAFCFHDQFLDYFDPPTADTISPESTEFEDDISPSLS